MSNVLARSQSRNLRLFSDGEGGPLELGHYLIIQGLAELGGTAAVPDAAGPLPTPPELVAVSPAVGAEGLIALPEFEDGDPELSAPTVGPKYHGARGLILSAPTDNVSPVYWSQHPGVRPLGAVVTHTSSAQYLLDPTFSGTPSAWASGDWVIDGAAVYSNTDTGGSGSVSLAQAVNLPAGNYEISINVATISASGGATGPAVVVYQNDNNLGSPSVGASVIPFTHSGGALVIRVDALWYDDGAVDFNIASVNLREVIAAAGQLGTPLYPGQVLGLSRSDFDPSRPVYIVPVIGSSAGASRVIARFQY